MKVCRNRELILTCILYLKRSMILHQMSQSEEPKNNEMNKLFGEKIISYLDIFSLQVDLKWAEQQLPVTSL